MAKPRTVPAAADTRSQAARETLTGALLEAASLLKVTQSELGEILGLSPSTVSRMSKRRYWLDPEAKQWQLAALFVRLFRSLDSITGGDDELSRRWLRAPNQVLGGVPAEMLKEVSSLVRVVEYLDASRALV